MAEEKRDKTWSTQERLQVGSMKCMAQHPGAAHWGGFEQMELEQLKPGTMWPTPPEEGPGFA